MSKKIIITGATSGFGKAMAERFAQEGHELWLTGRREKRLQELKNQLKEKSVIRISDFDVRDRAAVEEFGIRVAREWETVDVLINNAGLAVGAVPLQEGKPDDWEVMIDTNLKGLLYMTRTIVPLMIAQKKGHIINIGSTAGKVAYQNGNVYCATKFGVDGLSQAMRIDFLPYGIKVTVINPGMAETEFSLVRYKGDTEKAKSVYEGYRPLIADEVADIAHYCVQLPENVCINDLTVTCIQQANSFYKFKAE